MMKRWLILLLQICSVTSFVDENSLRDLQSAEHWNIFRFELPHTSDECFYIETKSNDTIHIIYQVLRGGDFNVDMTVDDPLGNTVFTQLNVGFGWFSDQRLKIAGTYRACFNNRQYFNPKVIYLGVLAVHEDLLLEAAMSATDEKRKNQTAIIDEFSERMMNSFQNLIRSVYQITAYQTIGRIHHAKDLYTIEDNGSYVQNWAICQIIAMIICSIVQVYTIRKLFKSSTAKKTTSSSSSAPQFGFTH